MANIFNSTQSSLKSVNGQLFLDYLALDLNYINDYKFSDYYNIIALFNRDKDIKKFNNFYNNSRLLDLIDDIYNHSANVKLYYNEQKLLAYFELDDIYCSFLINIKHRIFKNYKNIQHFINELEEYIETTSNI